MCIGSWSIPPSLFRVKVYTVGALVSLEFHVKTIHVLYTHIHSCTCMCVLVCMLLRILTNRLLLSLVPRPHPDFILQPWRKIRRRPGIKSTSTENVGFGWYVMWSRFRNDGNVPMHNVAGIDQLNLPQRFCQQLRTSQVPSH